LMIANSQFYQRIVFSSKSDYQYFYWLAVFCSAALLDLASISQIFPTTSWENNHCDFSVLSACILWSDPLEDFLISRLVDLGVPRLTAIDQPRKSTNTMFQLIVLVL